MMDMAWGLLVRASSDIHEEYGFFGTSFAEGARCEGCSLSGPERRAPPAVHISIPLSLAMPCHAIHTVHLCIHHRPSDGK
jgi:hypothetical protein